VNHFALYAEHSERGPLRPAVRGGRDTPLAPADDLVWSIVAEVQRALEAELGARLSGVMATGSRFNGSASPSSDIDLIVIVDRPDRQRRNRVVHGLEVELLIHPVEQIERYLQEDRASGQGAMQHMLLTGIVVSERDGVFGRLRKIARHHWLAGPPALAQSALWRVRYQPADMLRDVRDVIDDAASAGLLLGELLGDLLDAHYRIARRWRPKRKHLLADLGSWDPAALELAQQAADGSIERRLKACLALSEHVLEPVGGPMPLDWSTGWIR
jgi:Nucleotidyltransferase domain